MSDATEARIDSREDSIRANVSEAAAVADLIAPSLGPKGGDIAILELDESVTSTNDGATILRKTAVHPNAIAARFVVNVAKTQEAKCFDGTTSAVVFTGALSKKALLLVEDDVHPASIEKGYNLAMIKAIEHLETIVSDTPTLEDIAMTAMTGKSAEGHKNHLSKMAIQAATRVKHPSDINIVVRPGAPVEESFFTNGVIVDKQRMNHSMPSMVENPSIALFESDMTVSAMAQNVSVAFTDGDSADAYTMKRKNQLESMADHIVSTGANIVLCMKDIDSTISELLSKKGVYAARRVAASDLESIAEHTGAMIVNNVEDLETEDLGTCGYMEERKYDLSPRPLLFFEDCPSESVASLMLFAPTEDVAFEIGRALDDAVGVVWVANKSPKMLHGGGSSYMSMSRAVREYAETVEGRAQLAVKAFAEALEVIPATLARNCGLHPVDALIALRASHSNGEYDSYIDADTGEIIRGGSVVEPLTVVSVAVETATSTAISIIRIVRNVRGKTPEDITGM